MKIQYPILLILILVLLIVSWDGLFVVDETKQVIITRFGEPVRDAIADPGVHFKIPFLEQAHFFEKRFLEWDGDVNQVPTKDKRFIWVDTYARWQIVDPLLFFQRLTDESGGQSRLDDIIDGATRDAVANHILMELVRSTNRDIAVDQSLPETTEVITELPQVDTGRPDIMQEILATAATRTSDLGIKVIDVRFKRIDYNDDVRQNVYERMIAERKRIAQQYQSEGLGESARIRGEKERDLKEITSEAYRRSQELVGEADARATAIYAEAYNRDTDFYQFLKTMETYADSFDEDSWLILSTEGEFFRYLKQVRPR